MKAVCSCCEHSFSVPLTYAGKTVKCPKCKELVEISELPAPLLGSYILIAIVSAALAGTIGFGCGALLTRASRERTEAKIAAIQLKASGEVEAIQANLQDAEEEVIKLRKELRGSEREISDLARSTQEAWNRARELESHKNNQSDSHKFGRESSSSAGKTREERIERQFSIWNGSHRNLTKLIKESMNDPSSYKHVETRYADKGEHLIVVTTFRGKNSFGGVVKNSVTAKVDLDGNVISIISQDP